MYLRELLTSCRRRWPLLLAVLALVGGLCWMASTVVRPTYGSEASLVLVPPRNAESPRLNRLLDLSSLSDSVDVLARSMRSAETLEALEEVGPGTGFEVLPDYTTSAPILQVTATGPDQGSADAMLEAVLARVPQNLAQLQKGLGIKKPNLITTVPVARDERSLPDQKARLRVLAVLAAALLCAGVVLVGAIDGMMLRRRSRGDDDAEGRDGGERDAGRDGEPTGEVVGSTAGENADGAERPDSAGEGLPWGWARAAPVSSPRSPLQTAETDEAGDADDADEDQELDEREEPRVAVAGRAGGGGRARAR